MITRARVGLAALAFAGILAGCGDNGDEGDSSKPTKK